MRKKKPINRIWNAHINEMMEEGYEIVTALDLLEMKITEAERPSAIKSLLGIKDKRPEFVSVRYADLKILTKAWSEYKEQTDKTFGQCLGIEGDKRGKHRAISKLKRRKRDTSIAIEVDRLCKTGLSRNDAINAVAAMFIVGTDVVKKAMNPPNKKTLGNHIQKSKDKGQ